MVVRLVGSGRASAGTKRGSCDESTSEMTWKPAAGSSSRMSSGVARKLVEELLAQGTGYWTSSPSPARSAGRRVERSRPAASKAELMAATSPPGAAVELGNLGHCAIVAQVAATSTRRCVLGRLMACRRTHRLRASHRRCAYGCSTKSRGRCCRQSGSPVAGRTARGVTL